MKELLNTNLDIIDEIVIGNIEKIAALVNGISDKSIQKASIPSIDEQQSLADDQVALILHDSGRNFIKKFATCNPELTMLNSCLLVTKIDSLPEEIIKVAATNLVAAANEFKIAIPKILYKYADKIEFINNKVDVNKINKSAFYKRQILIKEASKQKQYLALDNEQFALPEKRKYPIHDEYHVKLACDYFTKYEKNFSLEDRIEYAQNVFFILGKSCPETIQKYANLDLTKFASGFATHMKVREKYIDGDSNSIIYKELFNRSKELGPIKTAALLHTIDCKLGLDHSYNKGLSEPIHVVFGMKKVASVEVDGKMFTQDDLNKVLSSSEITNYLDEYTIKELRDENFGLQVFTSLPKPVRKNLYNVTS